MTDHAELRRLDDSEVEQLLERYIKRFPGEHKAAMSRYFEAVHQELAPLARKLEAERDRLKAENEALLLGMRAILNAYDYADQYNKEGVAVEVMEDLRTLFKGATK
ncbi:hypothetical protein [Pseudomonas aeruginosa]|uniref:hypothetical protein n=1 Tax=Pseudomonas aeruginosa TaxID=287 RepID=UPI002044C485|nr:hypothetical protein [Pseudomonas aeruginosa]MCM4075461.1 hypothetical protein [Pseudomonas aeruginosa]MCM4094327.1 hypothetical protein [Pseudomonas aeruginosa]MCM4108056.1 hypothetical protein [Pseudomonas aeruginosa]MCM4121328.1 hypothetical protein [Pseudomonas aeruginosa]